jgi:hypothetical protein
MSEQSPTSSHGSQSLSGGSEEAPNGAPRPLIEFLISVAALVVSLATLAGDHPLISVAVLGLGFASTGLLVFWRWGLYRRGKALFLAGAVLTVLGSSLVGISAGVGTVRSSSTQPTGGGAPSAAEILAPDDWHTTSAEKEDVTVRLPSRLEGRWLVSVESSTQLGSYYLQLIPKNHSETVVVTIGVGPSGEGGKGIYTVGLMNGPDQLVDKLERERDKDGKVNGLPPEIRTVDLIHIRRQ